MTHYILVKVESDADAKSLITELLGALDSDNMYKHVRRAIVLDITNPEITAVLDGGELTPTHVDTLSI